MPLTAPRVARSAAVIGALALVLQAGPSHAGVVLDLSVDEMARAASVVVHGTVARVDAVWDDSHRRIFTEVEIDVTAYLAGQGPDVVRIRQVGGRVGDQELRVPGQPSFAPGEEVVVFLEPDGTGAPNQWVVVCMAAGKFTVTYDRMTGERIVGRDETGLMRLRTGDLGPPAARARVARPYSFMELADTVRRAVGGAP
jgi:hypothetical protein